MKKGIDPNKYDAILEEPTASMEDKAAWANWTKKKNEQLDCLAYLDLCQTAITAILPTPYNKNKHKKFEEDTKNWFTTYYDARDEAFVLLIYVVYAKLWYIEGQINYDLDQDSQYGKSGEESDNEDQDDDDESEMEDGEQDNMDSETAEYDHHPAASAGNRRGRIDGGTKNSRKRAKTIPKKRKKTTKEDPERKKERERRLKEVDPSLAETLRVHLSNEKYVKLYEKYRARIENARNEAAQSSKLKRWNYALKQYDRERKWPSERPVEVAARMLTDDSSDALEEGNERYQNNRCVDDGEMEGFVMKDPFL